MKSTFRFQDKEIIVIKILYSSRRILKGAALKKVIRNGLISFLFRRFILSKIFDQYVWEKIDYLAAPLFNILKSAN